MNNHYLYSCDCPRSFKLLKKLSGNNRHEIFSGREADCPLRSQVLYSNAMNELICETVIEKTFYSILTEKIPGIKDDLVDMDDKSCVFKTAVFFAAYTKKQIRSGDNTELKKCFRVADDILRLGSADNRQAIESVYMFALLRQLETYEQIRSLLTPHLMKVYQRMLVPEKIA